MKRDSVQALCGSGGEILGLLGIWRVHPLHEREGVTRRHPQLITSRHADGR
jgi:hypothetical protein